MGAAGVPAFGGASAFTERTYWLQPLARRRPSVAPHTLAYVAAGGARDPYAATPLLPLHVLASFWPPSSW